MPPCAGPKLEDTEKTVEKEFEQDMEKHADNAAQAAVTFADAVADQVSAQRTPYLLSAKAFVQGVINMSCIFHLGQRTVGATKQKLKQSLPLIAWVEALTCAQEKEAHHAAALHLESFPKLRCKGLITVWAYPGCAWSSGSF